MNTTKFEVQGNKLTVIRTFNASVELVWRAWTEVELLDKWWAPKPWKSETTKMDFKEGGERVYAMCGPKGEKHWALTRYKTINQLNSFTGEDAFCESEGEVNEDMPISTFKNHFESKDNLTTVTIISEYASESHLQQVIDMGMKEGLTMTLDSLAELLEEL